MALLNLFLLHLQIKHMATTFPVYKTHGLSSQLYCPLRKFKKREEGCEFTTLFFRQVASFAIFEHKMAVTSSRVYCCSTGVGVK